MVDLIFQEKMINHLTEDSVGIDTAQDANWLCARYKVNSITVEKDDVMEGNYIWVEVFDERDRRLRMYVTLEFGDDESVQDMCAAIERLVRPYRY